MYSSYSRYQKIESATNELVPIFRYAYPAPGLQDIKGESWEYKQWFERNRASYQSERARCIQTLQKDQRLSHIPLTSHQITEGNISLAMFRTTPSDTYKALLFSISQSRLKRIEYRIPVFSINTHTSTRMEYHTSDIQREYLQHREYVQGISRGFMCEVNPASLRIICAELRQFKFPTGSKDFAGISDIPSGRSLHYKVTLSSGELRPGIRVYDAIQEQDVNIDGAAEMDWPIISHKRISVAIALPGLGFPKGFATVNVQNLTRARALHEICHTVNDHLDGLKWADQIATYFKLPCFSDDSDERDILQKLGRLYIFSLIHIQGDKYVLDIGLRW